MKITSKNQMYRMSDKGLFGNRFRSWDSWKEVVDSGFRGLLSVRSFEIWNPIRIYEKSFHYVSGRMETDLKGRKLKFYEATPVESRVIQGELMELPGGLYFRHTFAKRPMREAFEIQDLIATGVNALMVLKNHVDPVSFDELRELLDKYPGCVVEFTEFKIPVGVFNRTMVVWEVRHY
ncbi:MAG: hypothetical protein GF411_00920 [Candidatus Lokiarchaeota archaeon]|nr:hypothetical protein [Candidatus Lokiarchaeota archaeon]